MGILREVTGRSTNNLVNNVNGDITLHMASHDQYKLKQHVITPNYFTMLQWDTPKYRYIHFTKVITINKKSPF